MQNILFVGAHIDDLELSCGGSVKRWTSEGKKVCSAILTSSEWVAPDGTKMRNFENIAKQCEKASKILGYKPFNLKCTPDFQLRYDDRIVVDLLNIVQSEKIDTLVTIWPHDAHPTHQYASQIALAATRKIPNVLLTKLSWNSTPQSFKPNFFVDVADHLDAKMKALQCYDDEYARIGKSWENYVSASATLYGLEANVKYAEAFEVLKMNY